MQKARISIIAAMNNGNRAIGKAGGLLWHLSDDLKRFKKLTTGHPIIMGRKTFESIGRALPNRTNIVITRNPDFQRSDRESGKRSDLVTVSSLEEAIQEAGKRLNLSGERFNLSSPEIFIIGGGEIYAQALPLTDRLYLTLVQSNMEGDTFFPNYSAFKKIIWEERLESQIKNHESRIGTETPPFRWITLEK